MCFSIRSCGVSVVRSTPWSMLGFIGKIYDEGSPLRVALAYEQATEWHKKTPTLIG